MDYPTYGIRFRRRLPLLPLLFLPRGLKVEITVNPPDIVRIEGEEFRIDMNNMEPLRPYLMKFLDSRYVIWVRVQVF